MYIRYNIILKGMKRWKRMQCLTIEGYLIVISRIGVSIHRDNINNKSECWHIIEFIDGNEMKGMKEEKERRVLLKK